MSFFRQLSLRTQMLAVVACIVLAGFALTLSILTWQAGQMQREAALRYASELAAHVTPQSPCNKVWRLHAHWPRPWVR